MTSRRRALLSVLATLLLLAGLALLRTRGAGRGSEAPAPQAAAPSAPGAPAPAAAAAAEPAAGPQVPAAEAVPMPGCFEGLLAFDQALTLEAFPAALRTPGLAEDRVLSAYLAERLTELVGADAEKALQVVGWMDGATHPALGIYVEGLKAAPAVHAPRVAERLLALGARDDAELSVRAAALDALETQRRLGPGAIARLKGVALDERVDSVAWVATRTLGRVMKEDHARTGSYEPYWKELLSISEKSDDMAVRLLALEMPSYSDPILAADSIPRLGQRLREDPERDVREMAAFRLAVTEDPQAALAAYQQAFAAERDLCVRWAMVRFAVRAAGPAALPVLEAWASADPRLRQDYLDFKELYAQGHTDFARLWLEKREHHACLVEEGAPH